MKAVEAARPAPRAGGEAGADGGGSMAAGGAGAGPRLPGGQGLGG